MSTALATRPATSKPPVALRAETICVGEMGRTVRVPPGIVDLASFHRWAESEHFPESGRIMYLKGRVWVDLTMEQLFTHNRVKTRYTSVLDELVESIDLGFYFSDGVLL